MKLAIAGVAALAAAVNAQVAAWGQCGGIGWSGGTTCVSGYSCVKNNDYYSQCVPGSAQPPTTSTRAPASTLITSTRNGDPNPTTGGGSNPTNNPSNPLDGYSFYANPYYSSEIHSLAIPTLSSKNPSLAAKATGVAKVGTFAWLDTRAKVPSISTYAADVQKQNKAGARLILPLVVYNLPNRDCAALASNGELSLENDGANLYKGYIDSIVSQIKTYSDVKFMLVIEPDSLANMVTNMNVAKCAAAADAYKTLTIYAVIKLNLPNVYMYLDAGHAGWLGWPANLQPAADIFASVYTEAGKPSALRGLATNVANYNAWSISTCPSIAQGAQFCDEKRYINAMAPLLKSAGFPAHFITDTSRNGKQPTGQQAWGNWCNVIGTGFGIRPSTSTDDPLLDAYAWIKPGGECDGTSDTGAVRYDGKCGSPDALKPAPEAGQWFQAYFEQLLTNANPAF